MPHHDHKHLRHRHRREHRSHWPDQPVGVAGVLPDVEAIATEAAGSASRAHRLARWAFDGHPWHVIVSNGAFAALVYRILQVVNSDRAVPPYQGETTTVEFHHALTARDDRDFDLLVEGIIEGPHHEVAANVIILALLEALFDAAGGGAPASRPSDGTEGGTDAATC